MKRKIAKKSGKARGKKTKRAGVGTATTQSASDYSLEFSKTGTNGNEAETGKVRLLKGTSVVLERDAFSGGNGFPAVLDGRYRVNLTIRGDESTNKLNPDHTLVPFFGIQLVSDNIPGDDGQFYNGRTEWGSIRARMNPPSGGTDHGDYLHGKQRAGDWTHGCVCDRTDSVAQALWGIGAPYPVFDFIVSTKHVLDTGEAKRKSKNRSPSKKIMEKKK